MAVLSVRALLRDAAAVFDSIERDQEPQVITRRGRPIAALVPINERQAEAMILSSAPTLIESRRRATNARAEGRTTSLSDALASLDADKASQRSEQVSSSDSSGEEYLPESSIDEHLTDTLADSLTELEYLVGASLATEVNKSAARRVSDITSQALDHAVAAGLFEEGRPKEQQFAKILVLNALLLALSLRREFLRDAVERIRAASTGAVALDQLSNPAGGLLGKSLADDALDAASAYVDSINGDLISRTLEEGSKLSPEIYEASLAGGISALKQENALAGLLVPASGVVVKKEGFLGRKVGIKYPTKLHYLDLAAGTGLTKRKVVYTTEGIYTTGKAGTRKLIGKNKKLPNKESRMYTKTFRS